VRVYASSSRHRCASHRMKQWSTNLDARRLKRAKTTRDKTSALTFAALVQTIARTHSHFAARASLAINVGLTLRNWTIGRHIQEFEQRGQERAMYGAGLFENLSASLRRRKEIKYHPRELRRCRQFYNAYPQIWGALPPESRELLISSLAQPARPAAVAPHNIPADRLLRTLSFTHFVELLDIADPVKRAFYETEAIRGNWTSRELSRQIGALLFERTALSRNKRSVIDQAQEAAEKATPENSIRDPYVFEFLGLKARDVLHEGELEQALLDRLQEFLLELGRGFCFEARQKRIVIGDENYFIDLVFYHRLLRCHVLIELKREKFKHEHLGQLNTYLNWYRRHEMAAGDNPPIGLLLCSSKDQALVEYALPGLDAQLFVSRYQLELPKKDELERFLAAQVSSLRLDHRRASDQ
jgi:predicted nuclease of restriction endonuclease-like (RecB) superfamily